MDYNCYNVIIRPPCLQPDDTVLLELTILGVNIEDFEGMKDRFVTSVQTLFMNEGYNQVRVTVYAAIPENEELK